MTRRLSSPALTCPVRSLVQHPLDALKEFQTTALSRLAARHNEITVHRQHLESASHAKVRTFRPR